MHGIVEVRQQLAGFVAFFVFWSNRKRLGGPGSEEEASGMSSTPLLLRM